MKKNITINLFGALYAIDEDAYELLKRYFDSMKSYFAKQKGGEEIADDIEHRVAELLWQKKESGTEAIDIDIIKEIINKIGNPADIDARSEGDGSAGETGSGRGTGSTEDGAPDDADAAAEEPEAKGWFKGRYIYRDPQEKLLGGVCSGLAKFFNFGNVVLWRLIFIVATIVPIPVLDQFGFVPVVYLVLWIVVPEALTPEDKLRMDGKSVTPENIKKAIISESTATAGAVSSSSCNNGCLSVFLKVIFVMLLLPGIFVVGLILFAFFTVIISMLGISATKFPYWFSEDFIWLSELLVDYSWLIFLGLLALIYILALPIYLLVRAIRGKGWRLTWKSGLVYVLTWILSVVFVIFVAISMLMNAAKRERDWRDDIPHRVMTTPAVQQPIEVDSLNTDTMAVPAEIKLVE